MEGYEFNTKNLYAPLRTLRVSMLGSKCRVVGSLRLDRKRFLQHKWARCGLVPIYNRLEKSNNRYFLPHLQKLRSIFMVRKYGIR